MVPVVEVVPEEEVMVGGQASRSRTGDAWILCVDNCKSVRVGVTARIVKYV